MLLTIDAQLPVTVTVFGLSLILLLRQALWAIMARPASCVFEPCHTACGGIMTASLLQAGMIIDDEINNWLVNPLPQGCKLHCIIDACHSGSVMDLPYRSKIKHGQPQWKNEYAGPTSVWKVCTLWVWSANIIIHHNYCCSECCAVQPVVPAAETCSGKTSAPTMQQFASRLSLVCVVRELLCEQCWWVSCCQAVHSSLSL